MPAGRDTDVFLTQGFESMEALARVTEKLLARGWSESDLRKFLGENLLPVAGERDAALVIQAVEQSLGLDGREVLHLVDRHASMTFLRASGSENRSQANRSPRAASQIAATAGC